MSEEELPSRRSSARFLTDLDVVLSDAAGQVIDANAQAHDLSAKGFRVETKCDLKEGATFRFSLKPEEEEPIDGQAQAVWVARNAWGQYNIGAKITKISWRDSRRLRGSLFRPGYDFVSLAKKTARLVWWIVVIVGAQNIIYHQPAARKIFFELTPVLVALFFFGWGLMMLVRRD